MNVIATVFMPMSVLLFLANVALASIVVCAAGLVLERICRRASLPFRHTLLVAALVSTLVAPIIIGVALASGRSLIHFSVASLDRPTLLPRFSPSSPPGQSSIEFDLPPVQNVPSANGVDLHDNTGLAPARRKAHVAAAPLSNANVRSQSFWLDILPLLGISLAIVWLIGCAASLCRLMLGLRQLRRLLFELRPVADAHLLELVATTAKQLGLRRVPKLYESNSVLSPLSLGLVNPALVLPLGIASSLDAHQLQGLFLHELAHIVRRDHEIGVLQRLATILFWWNPLTHRASARVSAIREQICDDVSTSCGKADSYAAMLVELAEHVVYSRALPATLGIFDGRPGEFSQRIHRLLDPSRQIVTTLNRRSKAVATFCFCLLLLPAAAPLQLRAAAVAEPSPQAAQAGEPVNAAKAEPAPDASEIAAAPKTAEAAPISWPAVLRGIVKDADGKPIAGAHVRFDFAKIHEYTIGRWDELLDSQTMVTGDNGEFRFDATKLPKLTHRPFLLMITCTAKGYADAKWWSWYSRSDVSVKENLTNFKMLAGRIVRGRCIDPDGAPVSGAIVKMAHGWDSQSPVSSWAWDPRKTQDDGTFEFSIPRDSKSEFEIWAVHSKWAPRRVALPSGGEDFGDVQLRRGSPIQGTVRNADGKPISGAVVVAESVDGGELKSVSFAVSVAARTDAKGDYTLQPLLGSYKVYLSQAEETDNIVEPRFVVADGPPPLVAPARLEFFAYEPKTKDFNAGPTLKVRGRIQWADDRPVERCEVKASYLPPDNGSGIWIARTVTNDKGDYTIELPNPIDDVSISVFGARDEQRVWHSAHPAESVVAKQKYQQNIELNPLDGDLDGMDWVLKAEK